MKTTNIGEFKDNLGKFIRFIEQGEVIEIRKGNIPIAKITPSFICRLVASRRSKQAVRWNYCLPDFKKQE